MIKVKKPNGWFGSEAITFTATDPDGNSDSDAATFTVGTMESPQGIIERIEKDSEPGSSGSAPLTTELLGNYPNPFNPSTTIQYTVSTGAWVSLKIFDVLGEEVTTLVDDFRPAGYYAATWNGQTRRGEDAASGVYLYRLSTGNFTRTGPMLLTK